MYGYNNFQLHVFLKKMYVLTISFKNVIIYKLIIIKLSFARCFGCLAIVIVQYIYCVPINY